MKILCIVGVRPNFIKIAPLFEEMRRHKEIEPVLVHTGQYYDDELSKVFFQDLSIPKPDYNLRVGSGSHAFQVGEGMKRFEKVILKEKPDLVIVVGDANACLIGALTASKLRILIAHIEAGLRSFDRRMPEEINRKLTDHLSDFLFCTEPAAVENLLNEGIARKKIFYVGNVMIDTLRKFFLRHARPPSVRTRSGNLLALPSHSGRGTMPARKFMVLKRNSIAEKFGLKTGEYAVLTLHRAENVDDKDVFSGILEAIGEIQKKIKIIWPIHPRTEKNLKQFSNELTKQWSNVLLIKPFGYLEMIDLVQNAKMVLTDSGGLQEETTVLGVPCLTLRDNTERPITCEIGTNTICGTKADRIIEETKRILDGGTKKGEIPKYWDGKTSQRIVKIIIANLH